MRLLTTAAFDRGKGEDTFGARDEDWQVYKLMSKDNDDDDDKGQEEDEAELARVTSKLQVSFMLLLFCYVNSLMCLFRLIIIRKFLVRESTAFVDFTIFMSFLQLRVKEIFSWMVCLIWIVMYT